MFVSQSQRPDPSPSAFTSAPDLGALARIAGIVLLVGFFSSVSASGSTPDLVFEGPTHLEPLARVLEGVGQSGMERAMDLVGLDDPGPPIRVVLAPAGSDAARRAPSWASAYAFGAAGVVVLLPDRIPGYPDRSLEEVLLHEITHVLVARAAGRQPVPRWFDEGIALQAARPWNIGDQARLWRVSLGGRPPRLASLDQKFRQGRASAAAAYALAGAFVQFLQRDVGDAAPARILHGLSEHRPFPEAFRRATGRELHILEGIFRRQLEPARLWLPLATSPTTLWIGISLLAVLAWWRIRRRKAEQEAEWIEEEESIRRWLLRQRDSLEHHRLTSSREPPDGAPDEN